MKRKTLSVIIPTYNSGQFLTQAIKSVAAQTFPSSEIIVVDDGSTDDTQKQLASYSGRIKYILQGNQGVSAARNRGVQAATGEFIAFLDADDVWHPRKIELQLNAIAAHPDLSLLATGTFDWPVAAFPGVDDPAGYPVSPVSWSQIVVRTSLLTSSVLVRHDTLDQAGPFDDSLQGPEDRDLFLRIAEIARVAKLDLPLTGYRNVQGSLSKQVATCEAGMRKILNRLDERKAWKRRWVLRRKSYSYMYNTCSYIHGLQRNYPTALMCLMKSLAWYPLPYGRGEVATDLERPKRMATNVLRMLRMKPAESDRPARAPDGMFDAVEAMTDPFDTGLETTGFRAGSSRDGEGFSATIRAADG
jgi:glycosyltransferase involved in cell wall biosynthesis